MIKKIINQEEMLQRFNMVKSSDDLFITTINLFDLFTDLIVLKNKYQFLYLLDIIYSPAEDMIHYLLINFDYQMRLVIQVEHPSELPSVYKIWKNAVWFERNLISQYGLKIQESGLSSFEEYSIGSLENEDESIWFPPSSITSGLCAFRLNFDLQFLKDVKYMPGFEHKGVNETIRSADPRVANFFNSRIDPEQSPIYEILWCLAWEELLEFEVSDRVKIIRMIFLEISRIKGHMSAFREFFRHYGQDHHFESLRILDANIFQLMMSLKGGVQSLHQIGGIHKSFDLNLLHRVYEFLDIVKKQINVLEDVFGKNSILPLDQLIFNRSSLIGHSVTGPVLRSSGINYDVRKFFPYLLYKDAKFEPVLGKDGTIKEVYLIRFEEMKQCLNLLNQFLAYIPMGPLNVIETQDFFWDHSKNVAISDWFDWLEINQVSLQHRMVYKSIETHSGELGLFIKINRPKRNFYASFSSSHVSGLQELLYQSPGKTMKEFQEMLMTYRLNAKELEL